MKLKEIVELENEVIEKLKERFEAGDNQAGDVLLVHLQRMATRISEWQKEQAPQGTITPLKPIRPKQVPRSIDPEDDIPF